MRHAWRFSLLVFPLTGAMLTFGGCSGESALFAAADGGTDGTTDAMAADGVAAYDAAPDDAPIACPAYGGTDPYCKAFAAACARCSPTLQPCDVKNFARCEDTSRTLSQGALQAGVECLANAPCNGDAAALDSCVRGKLVGVTPSPAQQKLAHDFCAECSPTRDAAAGCETEFFKPADAGASFDILLLFADSLTNKVDTTCIPAIRADAGDAGALGCRGKFGVCAGLVVDTNLPKNACKEGGT